MGRAKLSAFVVAYNREETIGTCLRALAFADEVIVIDKGSTDATATIAAGLADRVIGVPWTPTVEETRAFAADQCSHDWVLFLDDDECLSPEAVRFLDAELTAPRADIYRLAQRHYIMGRHDERAYYWPEYQTRCFRRGALAFTDTVHDGTRLLSDRIHSVAPDDGACIHHLSHRDAAQFIEKANRYTSRPDRKRATQTGSGLARFAHQRIDHWLNLTDPRDSDAYPVAVAVLRAVYDLIDRLKSWEEESGQDGTALFRAECARLEAAYAVELHDLARPHAGSAAPERVLPPAAPDAPVLLRAVRVLQDSIQAHRDAMDAARADLEAARKRETEQRERASEMQRWAEGNDRRAEAFEAQLGAFARHHEAAVAEHAAAVAQLAATQEAEHGARQAERAAAEAERSSWQAERASWQTEQGEWEVERRSWQNERDSWHVERTAWFAERVERAAERAALSERLARAVAHGDAAAARARAIEASTSWRITRPLRAVLTRLSYSGRAPSIPAANGANRPSPAPTD